MKIKLSVLLNLIAFILSFGGGFIFYRIELDTVQEKTDEYASLINHLVWSYNREAVSSFLQGALANREHLQIVIREPSGDVFAEIIQKNRKHAILPWWNSELTFKDDIEYKGEHLGSFELTIHDHERSAQFVCLIIFIFLHIGIQFIIMYLNSKKQNLELEKQIIQSEKMAAIGTMGAGIAHEINNPLTIVMGHAYLLQETVIKKYQNDPMLINMINKIISSVDRIKKIVEHMKDFSRNSSLDNRVLISVKQVIDDTLIFVMPILKKNQVELTVSVSEDLIKIYVNRIEIESVFQNLLVNASDAMIKKALPRKISITAKNIIEIDSVEITLSDNGEGIHQDNINKIFDPFFTTKDVGKGTGLGLAITKKIIEKHQGTIRVKSSPTEGTTFAITLPRGASE